jgi:pimeloyl-ACP methyl ester carboxylesterase
MSRRWRENWECIGACSNRISEAAVAALSLWRRMWQTSTTLLKNVPVAVIQSLSGHLIAEDLRRHIPHLEYLELAKCGHSPWLERQARQTFLASLEAWIRARTTKGE